MAASGPERLAAVISFDDRSWPMLLVSFAGQYSDEEFAAYLDQYQVFLGRNEPYAAVFITPPKGRMMSASHAKLQAEWMRQHDAAIRERVVALAFVLPSAVMRGALRAILWMQPMPVQHRVFATVAEAVEWAAQMLAEKGIKAPRYREHA
jgi:hypothetical protein